MSDINISVNTDNAAATANRYMKINRTKEQLAAAALSSGIRTSNPAYDPSSAAVAASITAVAEAQEQANRNVAQAGAQIGTASNALGTVQDTLRRLKVLTVQANSDTIAAKERNMIQQEFAALLSNIDVIANTTRWGGASLLNGGAGAATAFASANATASAVGLTAVANGFAGTMNTTVPGATQGLIDGIATNVTVTANGANYDVNVVIGTQTFAATATPVLGQQLVLVSTTDSGNSIAFDYDGAAVTALNSAAAFTTALNSLLGIGTATARAVFQSVNTTAGAPAGVTLTPGTGSNAGTWALSYTGAAAGGNGSFKLTRGDESYTAALLSTTASMTTTVSFNNGATIALAAFNGTANMGQELYTFTRGTAVVDTIQYGELASDTLTLTYDGVGTAALGVNSIDIKNKTNAANAANLIDQASLTISNAIASLGGKLSQLNFISDNLAVSIQNQKTAKGTFIDTSIPDALGQQQQYIVLGRIASSIFAKALARESDIAQMVQSVQV